MSTFLWRRWRRAALLACICPLGLAAAGCSGSIGVIPQGGDQASGSSSTHGQGNGSGSNVASGSGSTTSAGGGDASVGDAASTPDATVPLEATMLDPCAGLTVCDDFEATALGSAPRASLWTVGAPQCQNAAPDGATAVVDSTHAHSGTHALKVTDVAASSSPYCDHVFFNNTSAFAGTNAPLASQLYARFYVYFGTSIDPTTPHVSFATMTDQTLQSGANQIRLGVGGNVFLWNRASDDAFLPELDVGNNMVNTQANVSVAPTFNSWFCFEFHIDQTAGTIDTWIDGQEVPGMAENGTAVTDVSTVWLTGSNAPMPWKPQITSFGLGWERYFDTPNDPMTVWYDDVALAPHRIGCLDADP